MSELYRTFVDGFCSHANIEVTATGEGLLSGRRFAVKDIIDVAGITTGAGNPTWYATHEPAEAHAPVVKMLLDAGADMAGKAITEEFAYGLIGENFHYGTPVNPRAEGCVPGGSSSGSASLVASGTVDFALGTDTGGSVRVPAAFCGLYGIRPSHGRVPVSGILPLAPSLDTCGWFARDAGLFREVGRVLLDWSDKPAPSRVLMAEDAFEIADADVRTALGEILDRVTAVLGEPAAVRPGESAGLDGYEAWQAVIQVFRGSEAAASHLAWMRATDPEMGPGFRDRFEAGGAYTAAQIADATAKRAMIDGHLSGLLGDDAVMLVPAAPTTAPPGGAEESVYHSLRNRNELYNCAAPLARLPQISIPAGNAADGRPVGLGVIAGHGNDEVLLDIASALAA